MRYKGSALLAALVGAALAWAAPADARQDQTQAPQQGPAADSTILVFEREVFNYPSFTRRNPFRPLSAMSESGPNFESLFLGGVILSEVDPALSVALLGIGSATAAQSSGLSYRVRVGERIGNARVLEIQRMRVVFEVEEFGVRERRALEVLKPSDIPQASDPENSQQLPDEDEVLPDSVPVPDQGGSK